MQNPLISVIVPIYNVEKYLDKCVQSILAQTYTNLEIFLVDDGSPDRCGEMCDEYARQDSRVKVIHKPNGGLSDARNVAIDVANGEWIVFIDSDDFVTNDHIKTLYELTTKYNTKIAASQFIELPEGESIQIDNKNITSECLDKKGALATMFYQDKFETSAWGKIYAKSLFDTGIRYPYGKLYEDLPTTYRLLELTDKVAVTSKKTTFYLIRNSSIQGQSFSEKKNAVLEWGDQLFAYYNNGDKKVYKALCCRLFSAYSNIFFQMECGNKWEKVYWDRLCALRSCVLLDSKARPKARVGALLSYAGKKLYRFVFKLNA